MINWLIDKLIDWLIDKMIDKMIDKKIDKMIDKKIDKMIDKMIGLWIGKDFCRLPSSLVERPSTDHPHPDPTLIILWPEERTC